MTNQRCFARYLIARALVCALLIQTMVAFVVVAGCGGGPDGTTTVEGKITYNGQPVTSGLINFQTRGGRPIGGGINPDGTYACDLPPGEYQVRVDTPPQLPEGYKEGDPLSALPPRQVPEKFANFNTSSLKANITGEEDPQTVDFKLP